MHGGGGFVSVRQAVQQMRYARPWQQALFAVALLVAGVMLVVAGAWVGFLLAALGVVFSSRFLRLRLRARRSVE
ncbi:MAG TPA: hypothetical protein VMB51_00265 [Solirubrobacteraceae bacterium]|nr:hypothetical protein [Solirubrobacteraceae bacterium]